MADFTEFVRRPFKIWAVQITRDNIEELCELIGHEVRYQGKNPYIVVDKKIVPNGFRAKLGWWVTRMGDNLRCYPDRVFQEQFVPKTEEWGTWFDEEDEEGIVTESVVVLPDNRFDPPTEEEEREEVEEDIRVEVDVITDMQERVEEEEEVEVVVTGEAGPNVLIISRNDEGEVVETVTAPEEDVKDTHEADTVEPYE